MAGADRGWAAPPLTPPRSKKKAKPAAPPEPAAEPEESQAAEPQAAQPQPDDPPAAEPQASPARPAPDDTLVGETVPPLDDTLVVEPAGAEPTGADAAGTEPAGTEPAGADEVQFDEAPTDELPVIEDVIPARQPLTAPPQPDAAPPDAGPPADQPAPPTPVVSRENPTVQMPVLTVTPARPTSPPDPASLVSPERLAEFFAPRSIAVVGASDHSAWARFVLASAAATGFTGDLIPVHHVRRTVFGRPAIGSLRDLAEPVDLAFILVPTDAVESVIDDAGAAGVRGAIVLASGYRETGDEGAALERALASRAAAHGITLLGPNCLGFLNAHAGAGPFALTAPRPVQAGPVGIALQSGALASVMLSFARARAIGISTLVSMGNEAMITATDMIDYLVADEHTKVICLFLEQIGDPARFAAAAERARQAGKPIVALKAGSSPAGRQAALAHTGSVAGDDAVVDAALRQMNVIRVTSVEELLTTAALLGYDRVPAGRRMGVLTASGGACDIIADRAAAHGIELPAFSAKAAEAIAPHLPPFVQVRNPLDVTGYFLANQRYSALTAIDHALDAAVEDPDLDFVFFTGLTLPDGRPPDEAAAGLLDERVAWLGKRIASAPVPVIPVGSTCVDVSEYGRDLLSRNGIHLVGGIDLGIQAVSHAVRWAEGRDRSWAGPAVPPADRFGPPPSDGLLAPADARGEPGGPTVADEPGQSGGPTVADEPGERGERGEPDEVAAEGVWPEPDARALLSTFDIPLVPAELTDSPDAAAAAARRLGYPVALRISSAGLAHKSEAGGVALGLRTVTQVKAAFQRVSTAGGLAPEAIDGVTVSPMRTGGTELLAGVTVDPSFGPVLAVGLGGIWVEVLGDVSLRVLPVTPEEVGRMLGELRGAPLLRGARGQQPANVDALARVICAIGDAALSLGGSLRALEVNPLWVSGNRIEALDVLVETGPPASRARPGPGAQEPADPKFPHPAPEPASPQPGSPLGTPPGQHRTDPGE